MSPGLPKAPLFVISLLIAGCAAAPSGPPPVSSPAEGDVEVVFEGPAIDPALSAAENLQRMAILEAGSPRLLMPADVPVPPGVAPEVLARRGEEDQNARKSLSEAVAEIAATAELPEPAASPPADTDPAVLDEATRHYIRGREAALKQNHRLAIEELEQALKLDPANPAILRNLAQSHLAAGQAGPALELYEQLIRVDPDDSEAQFTLALADAARREFAASVARLSRRLLEGRSFDHDPLADVLAHHVLWRAMSDLGYDRASIEAGLMVIDGIESATAPTRYGQRALPIYQTRGLIRRSIGDAHCRLGEFEEARQAYAESASIPTPDPAALHPRVIYVDLQLGRIFDAQVELLAALSIDDRLSRGQDMGLSRYLAENLTERELLGEAVAELYQSRFDSAHYARCAAALLPREEAVATLSEYLQRHPDEMAAVGDLLQGLAAYDVSGAVAATVDLTAARPDLADRYIQHLIVSPARPSRSIAAVQAMSPSAARAIVEIRLLVESGALGEAWTVCAKARNMFPDEPELLVRQIELAGLLEEPELIDEAVRGSAADSSARIWLARSRARRAVGQTDLAVSAAVVAVEKEPDNPDAHIGLAAAYLARAAEAETDFKRRDAATLAERQAKRAMELAPEDDRAYQALLSLYGRGGLLENSEAYRQAGRSLVEAAPQSHLYGRIVAREELGRSQFEPALRRLMELQEDDPTDTTAVVLTVSAYLQMNEPESAERWLAAQLEKRPGHPTLLEQWVSVALRLGRRDEVITRLEQAWQSDWREYAAGRLLETVYRMTGRADDALALGEYRLTAQPMGMRRELELAALYGGAGREDEAYQRLQWLADRADEASRSQLVTVVDLLARLQTGDPRRSELTLVLTEHLLNRYQAAPMAVFAARLRAMADQGQTDEAFDALLARALSEAQGAAGPSVQDVVKWRDLAQALIDANHPCLAARALRRRLAAIAPLETAAKSLLMTITIVADAACGPDQAQASIELLRDLDAEGALPPFPWDKEPAGLAGALYEISQIYTVLGGEEGAEMILRRLLQLDGDDAMTMNNLGYAHIEAGLHDAETITWIERAHAMMPEEVSILDTIAWLRYKQRRFEDADGQPGAMTLIQKAMNASDESSAEMCDHLGDIAWRMGREDEALAAWREALTILEAPAHGEGIVQNYLFLQTRLWGLLVADPRTMYHRQYSVILERTRRKVQAAESGDEPPVAPVFEDLNPGE